MVFVTGGAAQAAVGSRARWSHPSGSSRRTAGVRPGPIAGERRHLLAQRERGARHARLLRSRRRRFLGRHLMAFGGLAPRRGSEEPAARSPHSGAQGKPGRKRRHTGRRSAGVAVYALVIWTGEPDPNFTDSEHVIICHATGWDVPAPRAPSRSQI